MKVLAFFALILAVASHPVVKTYTFSSLSDAMENSKMDSDIMPYFTFALNEFMLTMFGENAESVRGIPLPSPSGGSTWTMEEIKAALSDPATAPDEKSQLTVAGNFMREQNANGHKMETVEVLILALDISTWTLSDLNEALRSPSTNAALIPYLKKAHTELMDALQKGEKRETVHMVTPVGFIGPEGEFQYSGNRMRSLSKKTKKRL